MATKINPLSWGRRLAKEAIRTGKRIKKTPGNTRSKYATMAKSFKKGC